MHRLFVILLASAALSCADRAEPAPPVPPQTPAAPENPLTDRVWMRTDTTGLPGVMRVFLADGTLIMDSCWETYRLAPWRMASDSVVTWNEDGIDIDARILEVGDGTLRLRLQLVDGSQEEQRYAVATAPFVCPDMVR